MSRLIPTLILAAIAFVLAFVIAWVDHEPDVGERAADIANVLVRFEPELINRIEILQGEKETVLEKKSDLWFFSKPEVDRVDTGEVTALLDQINHLSIIDTIGTKEAGQSMEDLGLKGAERIAVTISGPEKKGAKDSRRQTIILGTAAPRTDSIYAKRGPDTVSHVVDGNPRPYLTDALATLRDRKVVSAPAQAIVQLVLRSSTGEIGLQRKITPPQQPWALYEPLQTWASPEILDQLMTDLSSLRIEEVVENAKTEEKIPNPLPENAVVLQMQVYGIETPLTIYLLQIETEEEGIPLVEARISDRPGVYHLHSTILDRLPTSAAEVRDRTLARIPIQFLDRIIVQSRIDPLVDLRAERLTEGIRWNVKINTDLMPANLNEVTSLVEGVNEARILDFTSDTAEDLASYGLAPPARQVAFTSKYPGPPNEDGFPGQMQEVTRILNLGWKPGDEQRLFANFEGEPHVYELDPSFVSMIPTHPIKWRSLSVLAIDSIRLRSITRDVPGQEKLKLEYDYKRDAWEATRNGVDATANLDVPSARKLRDRLSSLTASGWYLSLGPAYEALQTPAATFTIVTTELDRATGQPKESTYEIKLAKATSNQYFGQIEGSPDVFFLDGDKFKDLIRPVTTR